MSFWRRRPTLAQLEKRIKENIVDDEDEEAELPRPFNLFDSETNTAIAKLRGMHLLYAPSHESGKQVHHAQAYPKPLPIQVPSNLDDLPTLQYCPLDSDKDPLRLIVLLPHHGEPESIIQLSMFNASLTEDHYCYLAVRNTRGHPAYTTNVVIDGQRKVISRNVDIFLRNFRTEKKHFILYIREICVNREDDIEKNTYLNAVREDWIFENCCRMLDMDDFMEEEVSQEAADLAPKMDRDKSWGSLSRKTSSTAGSVILPNHCPIRLGAITTPPSQYRYLPLDIVAGEIRMLVLMPADNESDHLVAHLAHEPLYGPCSYACLSYMWGSMETDYEMQLNGQVFRITRNLDAALRALRRPRTVVVIWIDAISINQSDVREKNRQVPRMYAIYENAMGVVIWLGESADESDLAMDLIMELYENPTKEILAKDPNDKYVVNFTSRNCRAFAALCRLLDRPYFTRQWVVQEVAMASDPTIWCGAKRIPWTALLQAIQFVYANIKTFARYMREDTGLFPIDVGAVKLSLSRIHRLAYHRYLQESNRRASLLHLALVSQWTDSTNPRDKLYGLWDLAKDTRLLNMTVDYDKTLTEVYSSFVKQFIFCHQSLDIICTTQACNCASRHTDTDETVPSWCPDWRHKPVMGTLVRRTLPLSLSSFSEVSDLDKPLYCASRKTRPATGFFNNDRHLVCSGLKVDTLSHVVHHNGALSTEKFGEWHATARKYTHRDGKPISEAEIDEQFWSMLVGEAEGGVIAEVSGQYMRVNKIPEHLRLSFFETIENMLQTRTMAFTTRGFMALVPLRASVGMQVSILLGCSVPVLLEECSTHFHLRGSCFVQGWMMGEILDEMGLTDEQVFEKVTAEQPFELH